ncbi:hypothetical protein [Mesonia aquimarina]|uniref:hypothetical protein n=1 Tax=Mesonia aquimarina TaxID=1504967 RepID=UPI000EF5F6EF|nr:hypothetical protein [Mesonia aquimarina]
MNFKLSKNTLSDSVIMLAAVGAGIMTSNAGMALVPESQKQIGQGAMTAGGLVVSSGLSKDKSTAGKILKGVALGASAKQGYDLVTGLVKDKVSVPTENASVMDKLTAGALGLACPCDATGAMASPFLAEPVFNFGGLPENDVRVIDEGGRNENDTEAIAALT